MSIDDKCNDYKLMFGKLEQEHPELYQRIRLYANSCMGIETKLEKGTYIPIPRTDLKYLAYELRQLMEKYPEYSTVCNGLFERMQNIIEKTI